LNQTAFRPPAPAPRKARLDLLSLLGVLRDNPLEVWTEAHFEQAVVHDGLPFLPAIVLSDPNAIRHVLLDNASNYRKDDLLLRILGAGLRDGLLVVEGESWRRQRKAVASVFARRTIYEFAPAMRCAIDELLARWSRFPEGHVVDVAREVTLLTLNVLQRTIFSQGLARESEQFRDAMRSYFDSLGRIDPFDALRFPGFVPRLTRFAQRSALRFFDRAVDAMIEDRRRLVARGDRDIPRDLLTLLLDAADQHALGEAEVRANVLTFIAAGHETTANALIWSLYLLSQADEWAAKVSEEAKGPRSTATEDPCAHLVVTRAIIEEALRLYPPIAAITRVAIGPDRVADETVRPRTMVIVAPYVVHRHRRLWTRPDVFDPRRFMGTAREAIQRFAYLPFGVGPRTCIGASFALQEATLALSAISGHFRLAIEPGFEVEPLLRITLRPRHGLPMRVYRRGTK
jgi:cytochrome P450